MSETKLGSKSCLYISGQVVDQSCKLDKSTLTYLENLNKTAQNNKIVQIKIADGRVYQVVKLQESSIPGTDMYLQKNPETGGIRFVIVFPKAGIEDVENHLVLNSFYKTPSFFKALEILGAQEYIDDFKATDKKIAGLENRIDTIHTDESLEANEIERQIEEVNDQISKLVYENKYQLFA